MEKLFNYENSAVRVITDENEQIWFAGIDVCKILDYQNSTDIIEKKLEDDEKKLDYITDSSGQKRKTWIINEFGLYSLILTSTKPEAKMFKRWLTHDVLPTIRKAGKYTTEEQQEYEASLQAMAHHYNDLAVKRDELRQELKEINQKIKDLPTQMSQLIKIGKNQLALKFPET
jgi:prophage antirepressor-like protein